MLYGAQCLTTIFPRLIKLLFRFIIVSIFIFLCIQSTRYWTRHPFVFQFNRTCSFDDISACQHSNRTFLFIVWGGAGFCSELNQILLAFAYSVASRRRFAVNSHSWNYGRFDDYFHLPSSNNYSRLNFTFLVQNHRQNDLVDHIKTTRVGAQVREFWYATRHVQSIPIKRRVAHHLWQSMTNETLQFIAINRIQNLSNYIGIHVRKGDKLKSEARLTPLNRYITTIERALKGNGTVPQIFVASDDYTVVNELRQLKPTWNFFSLHDRNDRRRKSNGHFQGHFNRLPRNETLYETRLFLCELQMLTDARYVFCAMSSNVCRLIQILRSQHPSTVISMDRTWYAT